MYHIAPHTPLATCVPTPCRDSASQDDVVLDFAKSRVMDHSALEAIKDYYVEIIAKVSADDPQKEFIQTYVNILQAKQY